MCKYCEAKNTITLKGGVDLYNLKVNFLFNAPNGEVITKIESGDLCAVKPKDKSQVAMGKLETTTKIQYCPFCGKKLSTKSELSLADIINKPKEEKPIDDLFRKDNRHCENIDKTYKLMRDLSKQNRSSIMFDEIKYTNEKHKDNKNVLKIYKNKHFPYSLLLELNDEYYYMNIPLLKICKSPYDKNYTIYLAPTLLASFDLNEQKEPLDDSIHIDDYKIDIKCTISNNILKLELSMLDIICLAYIKLL